MSEQTDYSFRPLLGKVNSNEFEGNPPETLLLSSVLYSMQPGVDLEVETDATVKFIRSNNDYGHNHLFNKDVGKFERVEFRDSKLPLFPSIEFPDWLKTYYNPDYVTEYR